MDKEKVLKDYFRYLNVKGIKTRQDYLAAVRSFLLWCGEEKIDPLALGYEDVSRYRRLQMEQSSCSGTVNNKINRLRSFYRYLLISRRALRNPFEDLKGLRVGRNLPKNIVSPEEYEKLLSSFRIMKPHDVMLLTLIELLYGSALRISEAASLRDDDVDPLAGTITITEHKKERVRKLPATDAAFSSLKKYSDLVREEILNETELTAGYFFPQRGKTTLRCLLNNRLKKECTRLGLPVLTSHSFRHSAATGMLKSGAGIRHVQELLGHKKISMTQRYTHLISDDLKKVLAACHPREVRS